MAIQMGNNIPLEQGIHNSMTSQGIDPMTMQGLSNLPINNGFLSVLAGLGIFINIFMLVSYLLKAWGLYNINKKLGEKYPWIAFIPVIQVYSYFTASKKSWITYLLFPIIAIIIGFLLAYFTFGISIGIAIIYMLVMWIILLSAISKRTNRGSWTTIGFIFVPFIMFPIVGYKLKENNDNSEVKQVEENKEDKSEL